MMETADENAAMLQMTLESRFELMDDVGRKIAEDPEGAQDILTYLGEYANGYGFKRLCYMDATGWTISSDGKSGDFSFRTYFRRSMDGQYSITGEIKDRLGQGDPVHVMSAPVRDPQTGEVIGVVLADYTPEAFQKMMDVESFGGEGRGYIVESTGEYSGRLVQREDCRDGQSARGNDEDFNDRRTGRGAASADSFRQSVGGKTCVWHG